MLAVMRTRSRNASETSRDDNGPAAPPSPARTRPSPQEAMSRARNRDDDVQSDRRPRHSTRNRGSEPSALPPEGRYSCEYQRSGG